MVLADSPVACIRRASAAFFSVSALGRRMCCPRVRRAWARCCAAFPTEFNFKLGEAGQCLGRVRPVARQCGDQP